MGEVHKALLAARAEFAPIIRDKVNTFHKSKYADLEGVLSAVTPALCKYGLVLLQLPVLDGGGVILSTTLVHAESGESLGCTYPLRPAKENDPQALGACMTYARRYCALAILGVAAEDDDGNAASGLPARGVRTTVRPAATAKPEWFGEKIGGPYPEKPKPIHEGRSIYDLTWAEAIAGSEGGGRHQALAWLTKGGAEAQPSDKPGDAQARKQRAERARVAIKIKSLGDGADAPPFEA